VIQTRDSVQALLQSIIDYAGLFPPAKLDMPAAVRNYSSYLAGDDAWMLGRLIVPVARLDEFEQCAEELLPQSDSDDPWLLSALTAAAGSAEFERDLETLAVFNERHGHAKNGLAMIDVIEVKADSANAIDSTLDLINDAEDDLFPYFEIPIAGDPRGMIATLVGSEAGAKVRTGGVTADLYPTPHDLARFIAVCAAADVPLKATAGLHHPLRHQSAATGAEEFGFLNVFIAGCIVHDHELDEPELIELLTETSIDAFTFEDDRIIWRDHIIDAEAVSDARESFAVSFGSCSFDEPREELRTLGLL
jgi:hypothetical protein